MMSLPRLAANLANLRKTDFLEERLAFVVIWVNYGDHSLSTEFIKGSINKHTSDLLAEPLSPIMFRDDDLIDPASIKYQAA